MLPTGMTCSPPRVSPARSNLVGENRALMHVLTRSSNTCLCPADIVRNAISGGVVGAFTDDKNRYHDQVFLPSSCDVAMIACLITEGFFAPFLHRTLGDQFRRCTIVTESCCFEPLFIPVLLFPDCFYDSELADPPVSRPLFVAPCSENTSITSNSCESSSLTITDVFELHRLRQQVGVLLFKSINEIIRDAEVCKLKANKTCTTELGMASSIIALFYEVKMLLLCCIVSTERAYPEGGTLPVDAARTARSWFEEIFSVKELQRIFSERSRGGVDGVQEWFDSMLNSVTAATPARSVNPQELLQRLHLEVVEEGQKVAGTPLQLLHRPHDSSSTNIYQLNFVHCPLPHLPIQTGELTFFSAKDSVEPLLCDSVPSELSLLLRRCTTVKMTPTELREGEAQLAANPWWMQRARVKESIHRDVSNLQFLRSVLEKNCSFLTKLVQWLQEFPPPGLGDASLCDNKASLVKRTNGKCSANRTGDTENVKKQTEWDLITFSQVINRVVQELPFATSVAQFVRELVSCDLLSEEQFCEWMAHSIEDLKTKPPATVGCFAALVTFVLLHRNWKLPGNLLKVAVDLCSQNLQQQDCVRLLGFLNPREQRAV
uniref:Uncharacterized protein n=1 Tax=Trypanosoma congolense (strain IL3000) TaxID=1068625 RepID=G0UWE4_TRYCI|nr:conserved hypothetical protein [Trypanosoma congolense IL3000]